MAIDISKKQAFKRCWPKSKKKKNSTGTLDQAANTTTFFIIKESKENI